MRSFGTNKGCPDVASAFDLMCSAPFNDAFDGRNLEQLC